MTSEPRTRYRISAGCRWTPAPEGVLQFVARGDLDAAVHDEVADTLAARPPGSAPRVEIDLAAVTFLDAGVAELLERYRVAAARHGGEVRVVNAAGIPLMVLRAAGFVQLLAPDPHRSPDRSVAEFVETASSLIATSHALRAQVRNLAERVRRLEPSPRADSTEP